MLPQVDKCETCRFFGNFRAPDDQGLCYRYPPKVISDPHHSKEHHWDNTWEHYIDFGICEYPRVSEHEGCGEHKPRNEYWEALK